MIKAVIFDMDGVISNTEQLHAKSNQQVLRSYGIKVSRTFLSDNYAGMSTKELFQDFFRRYKINKRVSEAMAKKWRILAKMPNRCIEAVPGSVKLIDSLHQAGFVLALASASKKVFIYRVLKILKLKDKFEVIMSGDGLKHGKPHPAIFLQTAKQLNIKPHPCLVIEDGLNGMIAARRAKMKCLALVRKQDHPHYPQNLPVILSVNSLRQITPEMIINL